MPKSRKERPSSTSGRQKGENCHRSQLKTLFAKDSRLCQKDPKLWMLACIQISKMQTLKGGRPLMEVIEMKAAGNG